MIHLGTWQDRLSLVTVDTLIADPPYSARTHNGQRTGKGHTGKPRNAMHRQAIDFAHWDAADVADFVSSWSPRVRGWMVCLTSHDLIPAYQAAYEAAGRYPFAPIPCVIPGMTCRLAGDGPSSWAVYAMVARPKLTKAYRELPEADRPWGPLQTNPGAYITGKGDRSLIGGKPLELMMHLVRDYSRRGDLVVDPCCGLGTTLVAAKALGREWIGTETDPGRWDKANARLEDTPIERIAKQVGLGF